MKVTHMGCSHPLYGVVHFVGGGLLVREIPPNGTNSSKEEGCDHELFCLIHTKKQISEGDSDEHSFEPIEFAVPMGYLSTDTYARHCVQGVLEYISRHVLPSDVHCAFG